MDELAAGFWGAFFGTATLMVVASLVAFFRSQRRVALMAGLSALVSAGFVVAYVGWLPLQAAAEARLLAHVAMLATVTLALMLLALLGLLRRGPAAFRAIAAFLGLALVVTAAGWMLEPQQALALNSATAFAVGTLMLLLALRCALRGDRAAWLSVGGVSFMQVALAGLSWMALDGGSFPWPVHALTATAAMAYLALMACALWGRYAYLLELAEVIRLGPDYDPVTRMRSHSETGQMVGDVFLRQQGASRPVAVIAVCIANLYALENLHGRTASNHALFIYAGRLRRCVPQAVEMGRLGDDGFLLLLRDADDMAPAVRLARKIRQQLSRPVVLSTRGEEAGLDRDDTAWMAEIGVGILGTTTQVRPAQAVSTARAMARTAWSYGSRLAYFDPVAGQIAELPLEDVPGGARLASAR